MSVGVLFPGQGSQFVGMGADLFDARPDLLGDRADSILGWSLRQLCLEGPEDQLTRTEHAQPALFALSYALWDEVAKTILGQPAGSAGHSLGEYTALTAAGALTFDDALTVVAERGRAMADAADSQSSGMAALLGVDVQAAEEISANRRSDGGQLFVANINAPGQIVVAGGSADILWLVDNGRDLGVRRVVELKVAGAFHTEFMNQAAQRLSEALTEVGITTPEFPVWSNTTAQPHEAGSLRETLVAQVVSPVRFAESLEGMANSGIDVFVHVGPGDVTAGMAKRSVKEADTVVVSNLQDIAGAAEVIGTMR